MGSVGIVIVTIAIVVGGDRGAWIVFYRGVSKQGFK